MTPIFDLKFKKLQVVKSTNDFLKQWVKEELVKTGTFVFADFQTGGKGQRQKSWVSNPCQNLLFTMYFNSPSMDLIHFNYLVSVSLKDYIQKILPEQKVQIKWPNDILVDGKKIAGVLIEALVKNDIKKDVFVGIGLNVNQNNFPFFEREACSLVSFLNGEKDVSKIANDLAQVLYHSYMQSKEKITLKKLYEKSLYLRNKKAQFSYRDQKIVLSIFGISENGDLLAINGKGELLSFRNGALTFLE